MQNYIFLESCIFQVSEKKLLVIALKICSGELHWKKNGL